MTSSCVTLCQFLAGWLVQGVLLRMDQDTRAFILLASWGNSPEKHNFEIHIDIYYIIQYLSFSPEKTLTLRCYSVLAGRMIKGSVLKIGHYTRRFTLVAKWGNSPQWSFQRHVISVVFLHVSDHWNTFCEKNMGPSLEWYTCDICDSSALYVTPASGICDICGDIYALYMTVTLCIYINKHIGIHRE